MYYLLSIPKRQKWDKQNNEGFYALSSDNDIVGSVLINPKGILTMDFLAEQHQCGQHLLKLVARGNSIIAELLRLKDVVPNVYRYLCLGQNIINNQDLNKARSWNYDFEI